MSDKLTKDIKTTITELQNTHERRILRRRKARIARANRNKRRGLEALITRLTAK